MTPVQEEALYNFLEITTKAFELDEIVSYIRMADMKKAGSGHLAAELESYINFRRLAFPAGRRRWVSRRSCFEPLSFVISPTRLELINGILIPGHRCVPFANGDLHPKEYTFFWKGLPVPFTTSEGPPEEFYRFYHIFGEEYSPQYVAQENPENEEAFNADPDDDPPEVSIRTLDMRHIYRETSFVPGDRFVVQTLDWRSGDFELEKVGKGEWQQADLDAWQEAAEKGFEQSFANQGPLSCTEEQIAYAYWYGGSRMREVPAYALEEYIYEKTEKVESKAYGIESRFWYAGREIPDKGELDTSGIHPDITPIEAILHKVNIPVSEYVIHSYIRDSLYRENGDLQMIMERLIPRSIKLNDRDSDFLYDYVSAILEDSRDFYSKFTDKEMGPIRQEAAELHTAVIDLASQLKKGSIDSSWLPRHTFIVLSQIQLHTASVMEDLDSDESPSKEELEALDFSLDSMIETFKDMKELINEAMDNFRRSRFAVIRPGTKAESVMKRLIQMSIGGIDVWRRLLVSENCTLEELHQIIQIVFGWRNSQSFRFRTEKEKELDLDIRIMNLDKLNMAELLYEYGTKWNVRIMFLSGHETPDPRPVYCVAGDGTAPPEFLSGPMKFRRVLNALESGNNMERLSARQELGTEFIPGEFDIDACNRSLAARLAGHK